MVSDHWSKSGLVTHLHFHRACLTSIHLDKYLDHPPLSALHFSSLTSNPSRSSRPPSLSLPFSRLSPSVPLLSSFPSNFLFLSLHSSSPLLGSLFLLSLCAVCVGCLLLLCGCRCLASDHHSHSQSILLRLLVVSSVKLAVQTLRGQRALDRLDSRHHDDFLKERQLRDLNCLRHDLPLWNLHVRQQLWGLNYLRHDLQQWSLHDPTQQGH